MYGHMRKVVLAAANLLRSLCRPVPAAGYSVRWARRRQHCLTATATIRGGGN